MFGSRLLLTIHDNLIDKFMVVLVNHVDLCGGLADFNLLFIVVINHLILYGNLHFSFTFSIYSLPIFLKGI